MNLLEMLEFASQCQISIKHKFNTIELWFGEHTDYILSQNDKELVAQSRKNQQDFIKEMVKLYPNYRITSYNKLLEKDLELFD